MVAGTGRKDGDVGPRGYPDSPDNSSSSLRISGSPTVRMERGREGRGRRRRRKKRATAAIAARTITPPTVPPAIAETGARAGGDVGDGESVAVALGLREAEEDELVLSASAV